MPKKYALQIAENRTVTYTIQKKKTAKRIILKVINGELKVTSPMHATDAIVNEFVQQKKEWIFENISTNHLFQNGVKNEQVIFFRGKKYTVEYIEENRQTIKIIEDRKKETLHIFIGYETKDENIIKAIKSFMKKQSMLLLEESLERIKQHPIVKTIIDQYLRNYRVRFLKTAFGLCYPSRGEIVLNAEMILYDTYYTDYVMLHEVTHFLHQNHSTDFYETLLSFDKHALEHRKELNNLHRQFGGWSRR